jgi:hypothetical protein
MINCQNGEKARFFGAAPASPGKIENNDNQILSTYYHDCGSGKEVR